tara:strand:- start:529 stop:699 length:171 start_codon:yes stop_codon:yes gene_type:complete
MEPLLLIKDKYDSGRGIVEGVSILDLELKQKKDNYHLTILSFMKQSKKNKYSIINK